MLSIKKYARATAFLVSLFLSNMLNAACPTAGALVLVDSEAAISNGSELAFSPDGNYLALSSFDNDVRVYSVSPAGALNVIQTVAAPTANYIEYAPNGLHVAITDSLANLLTVFDVNLATGTLSNPVNYGVAAGLDFPNSLIYSPSGDFVTVSNFNANFVSVFTANKQTGALSFVNNFTGAPVLNGPISVACSPDGLFVAVAYAFSDTVRVFSVNQVTGALTQIVGSDVATLARPNFLAYSPDGRFAAVAHTNASFVRVYAVNQTTGVFSFLQDVVSIPAGGALDYAPDGKFATVVSSTTNQATVYSVDPVTGLFTPLQNPLTIGSVSEAVVYSPNGKFAAISNRLANTVSLYATNATATANDQTIPMISCNSAVSFMVDACGVGIHIISTTDPIGGSVAIIGDTELEFIPDANFSGSTSFTYTVEDDLGNTATATITITVSSGPSAAITASTTTICQGSATTIALTIAGGTPPYTIEWSDGVSGATSRTVSTTDTTGYFATVTDANGCFAISNTITITVNDTPTITISATPTEICSGSGSVVTLTAIVNGIPSPATVTWSDGIVSSVPSSGVATRTVSPLTTTIYSATTSNSCGSGNSNTFTVTVNQLPQVSSFVAMPSSVCLGESSTLVLSFTETASPFVISWSDGVTQTVTSSPAVRTVTPTTDTTYFAVITDNNGCEFTSPSLSVAVNNIPKVVLSSACDSICSGDLAILTLTLAGTAPFTINWSDGTSQTTSSAVVTHTVGPSSATSYFADVTDSNGCTTTSNTITITVNALPTATLAASPVTICSGDSTTLTLVMSGTSPFDVSWSDGVIETNVNSPVVRSVAPTTTTSYFATVVDANGCQITSNIVTVSVNPSPTSATLAVSQATICSGGSSTLITTIMGGTAPYTVTYLDGFSQAGSSPLVRVVSPTTTTTYSITSIVDANGCSPITLPAPVTIAVNQPPTSATLKVLPATICSGGSSTLTTTVTDGTAPYTVMFSDGFSQTGSSPLARVVAPTTTTAYSITSIVDANGCLLAALPASVTVAVSPSPSSATLTVSPNAICSGRDSTLTTTVTGGTAPYTVTYLDGFSQTGSSPLAREVHPVTTTTYTITSIVDANGCQPTVLPSPVTVIVGTPPTSAKFVASSTTICSGSSSTLKTTITGGTPPYTVTYSDGFTQKDNSPVTRVVSPTVTTTYTITSIVDANGCSLVVLPESITITVNPKPVASLASSSSNICSSGNVTLTLTITGSGPFNVKWSDGFMQTSVTSPVTRTVFPTTATSYSAIVTDSNGCEAISNTVMVDFDTQSILTAQPAQICIGGSSKLTLVVMVGTAPFDIVWSDGFTQTGVSSPVTRVVSPTTTTTYSAKVTDSNGCSGNSNLATVSVSAAIPSETLIASRTTICSDESIALTLDITGGGPFTINWSDGISQTSDTTPITRIVSPAQTTSYFATVTNACGSSTSPTVSVAVNSTPVASLIASSDRLCPGVSSTLTLNITGAAPFHIVWSDGFTQTGVSSPVTRIVSPTVTTTYSAKVTDTNGCVGASNTVTIDFNPKSTLTVSPNEICAGSPSVLTLNITGTAPFDIVWSDGFTQTGVSSPVTRIVSPAQATSYFARVTDSSGCVNNSNTVRVHVSTKIPAETLNASSTNICLGDSSILTLRITGGGPFDIVWSDGFTQTEVSSLVTRVVSPAQTTNYFARVTNACGSSESPVVTVRVNSLPTALLSASPDRLCPGVSSILTLNITGTAPFDIVWSDGFTQTGVSSPVTRVVSPTVTTSYSAKVTDSHGCQTTSNIAVVILNPLSMLTATPSALCQGETSVLELVISGEPPFIINWSDGVTQTSDTSSVIRQVAPAATTSYFATVTDGNDCQASSNTITIDVSTAVPAETLTVVPGIICSGKPATLTLDIAGGGPFIVNWSDGITQTSDTTPVIRQVAPTATTSYFATVTNACGSSVSPEVTVTVNPVPIAKLTASEVAICPRAFATLTLSVVGQGPFTVKWSDGVVQAGVTSPVIRTVSPIETTNYAARIIDRNGCEDLSNPVTVRVDSTLAGILAASPNPICAGISSILTLDIVGKAPFTIRWSDGVVQKTRQSTITRTITPSDTTLYTANITDGSGCKTASNNVTVLVNKLPHVTLSASKTRITSGEVVTLTAVPSGNAPFTLEWSDGFVQRNVTGITTRQVAPSVTTTYNLTIIDRNGCRFDPPKGVTVFVDQFTKVSLISKAIINKYC